LNDSDFESLDPANNYVTNSGDVGRLIYRTLTFIKDTPNEKPVIKPDLAEALGVPSDNAKTWTWKIRKGLKFEDGSPITAKDIKYGIERSFARDVYPDGATYMPDLLNNTNGTDRTPTQQGPDRGGDARLHLDLHFAGPQPVPTDDGAELGSSTQGQGRQAEHGQTPVIQAMQIGFTPVSNWSSFATPTGPDRPDRPALPDKFVVSMVSPRRRSARESSPGRGPGAFSRDPGAYGPGPAEGA
jgi:hypothetical protein